MPDVYRTCPNKCSGSEYTKQHDLTEGLFNNISLAAQQVIKESSAQASRCHHCGCVYLYESTGSQRLGTLKGIADPLGWKSSLYP